MKKQFAPALAAAMLLAACTVPAPPPTQRPPTAAPPTLAPTVAPTATAAVAAQAPTSTAVPAASPTPVPQPTPAPASAGTLTIVTHDSYAIDKTLIAEFEAQTGAKVQILKSGDAGAALNKSILSKGNPLGDVFFGVDNTFLSRALEADIFEAYAPAALDKVPAELKLDKTNRLSPIDVGYVNINYDLAGLRKAGINPPGRFEDLIKPEFKGKLAVQNPATSSPGLAFLLTTVDYFGESGSYTWKDFWRDLRKNDVFVAKGWTEAYYEAFSGAGGEGAGKYPLVVSYSTSPAAEVFYSEGKLKEPPTGNFLPPKGAFRQIEFAGILKGSKNPGLARKWMDFLLSEKAQADVYGSMAVYPAVPGVKGPEEFSKFAPIPQQPADLAPDVIAKNRDRWIQEWTQIVLR